jgi:O-antigen/teichoic acid export membrane protein
MSRGTSQGGIWTAMKSEGEGPAKVSFVRSVSWNYLGYLFEFCAGVLLVAYVVRRVPVEDYGIYLLAQSIAGFLYILDFGLSNVLVQLYVSTFAAKGMAEVSRLASTLFVALLGVGTLGATVLALVAVAVPQVFKLPGAQMAVGLRVLLLAALAVPLTMPAMALDNLCQAFHRFDRINQVQMASVLLRVGLTLAVLAGGKGIVGLAAVQAVVSLARLLGLWAAARGGIGGFRLNLLRFDRFRVREAMRRSGWAFGDDVSRRIGMNSESVILAGLASFRQVAMFGMGSKLPAHIFQFAARGLSVMMPSLARHHSEGDTAQLRETYRNAYRVCVTGLLPPVVFAAICSRQLVEVWAGPAYAGAGPVLAWLLVAALSQVLEFPSDLLLYSHDRIRRAARFSVIETVGKIALALLLVVPFGAAGVAAGVAIWHWCVNLFCYLPEACRVAGLKPWELWRAALMGSAGMGSAGSGSAGQWGAFAAGTALLYECSQHLPAAGVFAACTAVCAAYAGVWSACTALPMWRAAARDAAPIAL